VCARARILTTFYLKHTHTHTACTEVGEGNTVKLGRGMEASGLGSNNCFKSITFWEISEFPKNEREKRSF